MKVVLLGGYGQFGRPTARHLVRYDLVEEVVIAGRDSEKARQVAAEIGHKARALQLDGDNAAGIEAALEPGDMLVSFMWDQKRYQQPLIKAAIKARAHYCDLRSQPPTPELDAAARDAGVTALIGVGSAPGMTDLMDKLAISLLDEVDYAVSGFLWALLQDIWDDIYQAYFKLPGGLDRGPHGRQLRATLGAPASKEARLNAIRDGRVVEMFLYLLSGDEPAPVQLPAVRDPGLVSADPLLDGVDVPLGAPKGGYASAPVLSAALPEELDGIPHATVHIAGLAQPFTDLVQSTAAQLRAERLEFDAAVTDVHQRLAADLSSYLLDTDLFASIPGYFTSVYGRLQGRPARGAVWAPQPYYTQRNWLDLTAANVAVSVLRLLRGDIDAPGAHFLEDVDALDDAYLAEVQSLLPEVPAGVPLVDRGIEFLGDGT